MVAFIWRVIGAQHLFYYRNHLLFFFLIKSLLLVLEFFLQKSLIFGNFLEFNFVSFFNFPHFFFKFFFSSFGRLLFLVLAYNSHYLVFVFLLQLSFYYFYLFVLFLLYFVKNFFQWWNSSGRKWLICFGGELIFT